MRLLAVAGEIDRAHAGIRLRWPAEGLLAAEAARCASVSSTGYGWRGNSPCRTDRGAASVVQPAPLSRRQAGRQWQPAKSAPVQGLDPIAHRRQHALDLVVLAFGQRQVDAAAIYQNASGGTHWLGVIIEHHSIK